MVNQDNFLTHQDELNFLQAQGFPINPYNSVQNSLENIWEIATKLQQDRNSLPYPIDGLVVKLDDNKIVEQVGVVGKTPRAWCAIKFPPEEIATKLEDVIWQVGRTGKVTPVASLQPINLMGTVVKKASLHNFKEVNELQLHYHDTVVVRKAGDIIPEVVDILVNLRLPESKLISIPQFCPSCNSQLSKTATEVDLICLNSVNCKDQIVGRLSYYCQRNLGNITGLSEKQIEKFMNEFGVKDIPDLYNLPWEKIEVLEGFGKKSVENLQKSVENSRSIADYKFLAGLGIEGVGVEIAKLIAEQINNYD